MTTEEMAGEQELLSLDEAAEFLCVSRSTMYRLLDQDKLHGMKAGKQWRFRKEDLLAYMQRGPAALALENASIELLNGELAFFAEELTRLGVSVGDDADAAQEGEEGKVTLLARRLLALFIAMGGSDVHLEPVWDNDEVVLALRYRIEGELHEVRHMPIALHAPLVLELKRLSGLSIEERERPQSGQLLLKPGRALFRIAIVPTMYGEKIALRTLPTRIPSMNALAIDTTPLAEWIQRSHGLILVTGPTGSGKATSRAACISELLPRKLNIMSVEGVVEYLFPQGVTHLKVEQFSCAEGLQALMEQDPDVVVVGDILENAEVAQRTVLAAELGHLVMSCVHAHDAVSPLYELLDMGVKRSLLTANVIGIVTQHLLWSLCDACKRPCVSDPALLEEIRKTAADDGYTLPDEVTFYEAVGCEACHPRHPGYKQRFALHEYFTFTPALRAAFLRGAVQDEFTQLVRAQGQLV